MTFVDPLHGFLAGPRGVWSTTDGGRTWRRTWRGTLEVTYLDAVDAGHVWAIVRVNRYQTHLLLSADGGRHWALPKATPSLSSISMVDATHGWAVTGWQQMTNVEAGTFQAGSVLRTSDGGRTWTDTGQSAQAVCAAGPDAAWAASGVSVLRTTDGGVLWSTRALYPTNWYGEAEIGCAGANVAWDLASGGGSMSQEAYLASLSDDGGTTWTPRLHEAYFPLPPGIPRTHAQIDAYSGPIDVVSPSTAFFAGSCPACETVSVTGTDDGGRSFFHAVLGGHSKKDGGTPLAISFVDASHGWLLVKGLSGSHAELWRTADGGHSWFRLALTAGS